MLFIPLIGILEGAYAQTYDLVDYYYNGTPVHGVKIKTNIPFQNYDAMPTVRIEGYSYGHAQPIGLDIVWYIINDEFSNAKVSSWGAYTPPIYLSEENGLVAIFISDKPYFQRFHISAYAKGLSKENSTSFSGWSVVDDTLAGDHQLLVPYQNGFKGKVTVDGNVLIGKTSQTNPSYKLDVNGNIRANKVVVNTTGADYVFDSTFRLLPIDSLQKFIKRYHHLPDVPAAGVMSASGMDVGDMQKLQLQKIEELTLYLMQKDNEIKELKQELHQLRNIVGKETSTKGSIE
jgi:hypothetical protein